MIENNDLTLSIIIFVVVYILIIWDKLDRVMVALTGAFFMVLLRILSVGEAFASIDFNTIGLLVGMMIIVMIMKRTGVFKYLGMKIVKISKAIPFRLLILLSITTGVLSALLDNVTTILLILPVILSITKDLKLNPIPFIMTAIFSSNIGGAATLIGDPPNIMIGSRARLNFIDFLMNNAVIAIPILMITSVIFAFVYRKNLGAIHGVKEKVLTIDEKEYIKDKKLLNQCLIIFILVIIGFLIHGALHLSSSTIALTGAVLLLFISGVNPGFVLLEVEWKTIFFFCGLFILVGGLESTGVIVILAEQLVAFTGGDLFLTAMAVLWFSAIASAFIDNIPFVATMIPLLLQMTEMTDINIVPLWWALSLGACLGGNGTMIGASANIVAIGIAEREGYPITFGYYFIIGFPLMLLSIAISTIYIIFTYLI